LPADAGSHTSEEVVEDVERAVVKEDLARACRVMRLATIG
jgi:hypothetical protein